MVVAVTTNIESQEFRRCYGEEKWLRPEHPRGKSTDVEGIFAFLHELLGLIFDEKAFHDAFPKVMLEYESMRGGGVHWHGFFRGADPVPNLKLFSNVVY